MVGFKSFAERTEIEFGAGISAVIGPNGSGKSNLADALRWTLGEQGRSLRIRRAEDVIFAGSERRHAIGMADVTLLLDNADRLLPLDFAEVALGRRLFRSGENDYLVNRQRVRHRDLVDLLDSANLAENAFLFIGQGMVDQALALRPEERRVLFEEVAGVRRHERRRRQADAQLLEAEANLARVRDVLAELRPQARRLSQQVEQEEARRTAADDLAAALVAAAHTRWHAAMRAGSEAVTALATARRAALAEQDQLRRVEAEAVALGVALAERATLERAVRADLDALTSALTSARLGQGRAESELEALTRDRRRLDADREQTHARMDAARRQAATPIPAPDPSEEAELAESEHALAEALAELAQLRAAARAAEDREGAIRRAEAARARDLEAAMRRAGEAHRALADQEARAARATEVAGRADVRRDEAGRLQAEAIGRESETEARELSARSAAEEAEARWRQQRDAADNAATRLQAARGRMSSLAEHVAAEEGLAITQAARRRGGTRLAEGLDVEPALRVAVEAALGDAIRAAALARDRVPALRGERGLVVLAEAPSHRTADRDIERARATAAAAGGGPLGEAIRRDPGGTVGRLLETVVWVPTLQDALAVAAALPPGWSVASREGDVVTASGVATLGGGGSLLERRAERDALAVEIERLEEAAARLARERDEAGRLAASAREARDVARREAEAARRVRRSADEAERAASRAAESAGRELAWERAQVERLTSDAERAAAELEALEAAGRASAAQGGVAGGAGGEVSAAAAWEQRVAELRRRRDRVAGVVQEHAAERRRAEDARNRAEATLALDEARLVAIDAEAAALASAIEQSSSDAARLASEASAQADRERAARASLDAVLVAGGGEREELGRAERTAAAHRARLRDLDDAVRAAEVAELETRLAREAMREQVLVELASLGQVGLASLTAAAGGDGAAVAGAGEDGTTGATGDAATVAGDRAATGAADGDLASGAAPANVAPGAVEMEAESDTEMERDPAVALEAALDAAAVHWSQEPPPTDTPPAARLATLRRRFHELGAGNPLAVDEYAEVRARLDGLEAQREDLERAIRSTRELIVELDRLIAEQFRTTFLALEDAFGRRFTQLFGGGVARLSLTDPDDLDATGVEITAQPPGKRRQPLAMLSGGERALTAVALLFAMLEVRPVPFCVLDEVDAALDEANVGRFADALRELASRTQCIVITHNRGTIEVADALYGVTIGDDAVSRVISLRLEEARTMVQAAAAV
jgi:chromosome segregation protein